MRIQWHNSAALQQNLYEINLKPKQTLAKPLLDILHMTLNINQHVGGICANPQSTIPTHEIAELETILKNTEPQTILVQNETDTTQNILKLTNRYPQHTIYIITPKNKLDTGNKNFITIRKNQVGILPPEFWKGYHTGITYAAQDWALTYPTKEEPKIPPMIDYSQETTPPYIKTLLTSTSKTAMAFLSGGISVKVIQALREYGIPEKYHRKLHKALGKTILEHQHEQ